MTYAAPLRDIAFSLEHIGGLSQLAAEAGTETVTSILEEAGKFAAGTLAPLNARGDKIGVKWQNGKVLMPDGFFDAYRDWWQAGWNAVDLPEKFGGMGLPTLLATAVMELWTSACMSFAMGPVLTQGAVDALVQHGSQTLQDQYLPKLVSGEWTATMNLTEPQAGSDLGALTTKAIPQADGTYKITGSKIFISFGEHDLTQNIIHLVLARLPDAPAGSRGISLFLVPKFLVNADGSLGDANDVRCSGVEHKMGIHASPTCMMSFGDHGGATGWIIGEPHKGLACMFTMMNKARLFTGLQGVAIGERAMQQGLDYAKTRKQGKAAGDKGAGSSPIILHPDVQRNLLSMKAQVMAGRALAHAAAAAIDHAHVEKDPLKRQKQADIAGLLTPLVKSWCTDMGVEVTSINVQVHGGMGFIEETGAAQHFRDARIPPIYEGTNGIQAIDLVMRKLMRDGGKSAQMLLDEYAGIAKEAEATSTLAVTGANAREALEMLTKAMAWMLDPARRADEQLASATPFLNLFALAVTSSLVCKLAIAALHAQEKGGNDPYYGELIALAQFYAENFSVKAQGLARVVMGSAAFCAAIQRQDFMV